MKIKYFVISLPRSGTASISRMASIVGMRPQHAPVYTLPINMKGDDFDFFSDTPVFCPTHIVQACECLGIEPRFIYIEKDSTAIYDSWKKVGLYANYLQFYSMSPEDMNAGQKFDFKSYKDAFSDVMLTDDNYAQLFESHKNNVVNIVKSYNKDILMYKFTDGWEPFCQFTSTDMPTNEEIPHLNKDTMFDNII